MARKSLVVGNWKCNGSVASNEPLLKRLAAWSSPGVDVAVCVPFVYLAQAHAILSESPVALGAQNVGCYGDGAFTGEVSAAMLADVGCRFVVVGHSERRMLLGETDDDVARKVKEVLRHGMCPIVCLGETESEYRDGKGAAVVGRQLAAIGDAVTGAATEVVVAYEPVWAIGTGLAAGVEYIEEMHGAIREALHGTDGVRILYGGSVKPENAASIFSCRDVDGGLIGGASLNAGDFEKICQAAISRR